jgi:hypothetical protein
VETVRSHDYSYFCSEKSFDFGPLKISGAIALRSPSPNKLVFYEVLKGSGIEFRVGQLSGTTSGEKLEKAWIRLTRKRKVELKFPDITQDGDTIILRPAEMASTVGYEIDFHKATARNGKSAQK